MLCTLVSIFVISTGVKKTLYITTKPQALQLFKEVHLDKLCETYSKENLQHRENFFCLHICPALSAYDSQKQYLHAFCTDVWIDKACETEVLSNEVWLPFEGFLCQHSLVICLSANLNKIKINLKSNQNILCLNKNNHKQTNKQRYAKLKLYLVLLP